MMITVLQWDRRLKYDFQNENKLLMCWTPVEIKIIFFLHKRRTKRTLSGIWLDGSYKNLISKIRVSLPKKLICQLWKLLFQTFNCIYLSTGPPTKSLHCARKSSLKVAKCTISWNVPLLLLVNFRTSYIHIFTSSFNVNVRWSYYCALKHMFSGSLLQSFRVLGMQVGIIEPNPRQPSVCNPSAYNTVTYKLTAFMSHCYSLREHIWGVARTSLFPLFRKLFPWLRMNNEKIL